MRLSDLAVQDAFYARAIGRIRSFCLTIDPAAHKYWMLSAGDDPQLVTHHAGQPHSQWHQLSHAATAVDAVTSVIAGVLSGMTLGFVHLQQSVLYVGSTVAAVTTFGVLFWDQARRWRRSSEAQPTRFFPDGTPVISPRTDKDGLFAVRGHPG